MMFLVEKDFIDKKTKKTHMKGTIYTSDDEKRIEELRQKGFIGVELIVKEEPAEPVKEPKEEAEKETKKDSKKK